MKESELKVMPKNVQYCINTKISTLSQTNWDSTLCSLSKKHGNTLDVVAFTVHDTNNSLLSNMERWVGLESRNIREGQN